MRLVGDWIRPWLVLCGRGALVWGFEENVERRGKDMVVNTNCLSILKKIMLQKQD